MSFSVLIIVKNRHEHLLHVLDGVILSTLEPAEIIIVHMNEDETVLDTALPVKQVTLRSTHPLPLAAARNMAAKHAATEQLIFLDVDCIPAMDCFERLLADLQSAELVMADPRYLVHTVKKLEYGLLETEGHRSPARKNISFGESDKFELFWSLGFAIRKKDFEQIDGFNEAFIGYGGEDTDFAFRARQAGLKLYYSQARIYHQNHPSYDPPLNWLEDIVANAKEFKAIWHIWPMQGWLQKFADMGYVSWSDDSLTILKLPTETEIAAVQKPDAL